MPSTPADLIDDANLAARSLRNFGEMIAALGTNAPFDSGVVRRPDAVGARIGYAGSNPWFNGVVVPLDARPPADDPALPFCVWTVAGHVPGRVERPDFATPCLGIAVDAVRPAAGPDITVETPTSADLGDVNERAYGDSGTFGPLARALSDERMHQYGVRANGAFVCVALGLAVGDDLGIHYVATEEAYRRRGLASRLLTAMIQGAAREGMRTATLQASADGLGVYERLGFRRVATLRGFVRPCG